MVLPGRHIPASIFVLLVSFNVFKVFILMYLKNLGDDQQALIWDVQCIPRPVDDPILAYSAGGEVSIMYF